MSSGRPRKRVDWAALGHFLGLEFSPVSHGERWVSLLGGVLCIPLLFAVSRFYIHTDALVPVVASMGASAVLLFAVPHGALSQPWPLVGGHIISAIIGVTCSKLVGDPFLASGLAVGLAIGAMHYLRCIHPPGGATALVAVIGGPAVSTLGYQYVLTPVAINAAIMLIVALVFNALFPWRRYPASLHKAAEPVEEKTVAARPILHEDFVYALSQLDTFVDVSEEELLEIYALATGNHRRTHPGREYAGVRLAAEGSGRTD